MKFCPFCGAPRELENSAFCMKCGSRFPAAASEEITEKTLLPRDDGNSGDKKIIIIDAVLAALIVALAALIVTRVFSA